MELTVEEERKKVNVYVERSLWKKFMEICRKKDIAASWAIREYIRDTVQNEERRAETETPEE